MNFGLSLNFAKVDLVNLKFPATMEVDYIRVYQPKNAKNIGCDPPDYPTKNYIDNHPDAYGSAYSRRGCINMFSHVYIH